MKNVCFFTGTMSHGGGTEHMTQLVANELARTQKYHVFVLSKCDRIGNPYYVLDTNVTYDVLDNTPFKGWWSVLKDICLLRRYIKKYRIDILINVDVGISLFSLPLTLATPSLKQVFWEHFSVCYSAGNKRMEKLRMLALKYGRAYVTLTPEDADSLLARGTGNCSVRSIPNICPYPVCTEDYDTKSRVIISIGNTIPVKGFDMAIQVAGKVFKKHPDWIWKIYGAGSSLGDLREQVKRVQLEKNVLFEGQVKNLVPVYKDAAFLVMTSRSEGFGMVLAEAQAFHLPTIAFDVPYGPRNVIENGVNGFLIPPFDIDQMVSRIEELIENNQLRINFSSKATMKLNKLSITNVIGEWDRLLEEL